VLPSAHRMRRSRDIDATVRGGTRSGRTRLVVHLAVPPGRGPATAGFAVPRAVGGAVVRNRVRRRLRHLVADRIDALPDGARLVVRALPPAAAATSAQLAADLDGALRTALRRIRP
jgi:ribonuclease P protein component